MKPVGALTWDEALKVARHRGTIYKVWKIGFAAAKPTGIIGDLEIQVRNRIPINRHNWYPSRGDRYLFDNYFHDPAYSLELKAQHEARSHANHSQAAKP
jgi:hypothetical protein